MIKINLGQKKLIHFIYLIKSLNKFCRRGIGLDEIIKEYNKFKNDTIKFMDEIKKRKPGAITQTKKI